MEQPGSVNMLVLVNVSHCNPYFTPTQSGLTFHLKTSDCDKYCHAQGLFNDINSPFMAYFKSKTTHTWQDLSE